MRVAPWLLGLAVVLCCCSDRSGSATAVPKRYAYPRIAAYDTVRAVETVGPVRLSVNEGAAVSHPEGNVAWLNAHYGWYGATLYLSATRLSTGALEKALANRRERISLNLGGAKARHDSFDNGNGIECELVVSLDPTATPVQFVAYGHNVLVNGAFVLQGKTEPADSLRPICEKLENEAFEIVRSIRSVEANALATGVIGDRTFQRNVPTGVDASNTGEKGIDVGG